VKNESSSAAFGIESDFQGKHFFVQNAARLLLYSETIEIDIENRYFV